MIASNTSVPLLNQKKRVSFYNATLQSNATEAVNILVVDVAQRIFDSITPADVKSKVSQSEIEYTLQQLNAVMNSNQALQYLTANDNEYLQKITLAIESGMRDVFSDSAITMGDLSVIFKMVKEVAQSLNSIHDKGTAVVEIGSHTLLPLIEIIIVLVAQMILPPGQFALMKTILGMAFDMLSTNITPLTKQPCCVWLRSLSCLFPQNTKPI